jgi:hypothetical protein
MDLPSLLDEITTLLPTTLDPHQIYNLNLRLSEIDALLSRNDSEAR